MRRPPSRFARWWQRASPARCSWTTDDCQASYERLSARGVEFHEAPEERPYGIDSGFRDPSGNSIRLTQVRDLADLERELSAS